MKTSTFYRVSISRNIHEDILQICAIDIKSIKESLYEFHKDCDTFGISKMNVIEEINQDSFYDFIEGDTQIGFSDFTRENFKKLTFTARRGPNHTHLIYFFSANKNYPETMTVAQLMKDDKTYMVQIEKMMTSYHYSNMELLDEMNYSLS